MSVPSNRRRRHLAIIAPALLAIASCVSGGALPARALDAPRSSATPLETAIEAQTICVGSSVASAGDLGDTLYYRESLQPDGTLAVGYWAFFSEERPWGNNWLTWTVVPALALELVYTRALLVAPGLQQAAYGKGDVEGFRVMYDVDEQGGIAARSAVADDMFHREVRLDRDELFAIDAERPTVYSDWWSHQLGGRGARSASDLAYRRCFGPGEIRPLPPEVAAEWHLERRARPAHVVPAQALARGAGTGPRVARAR